MTPITIHNFAPLSIPPGLVDWFGSWPTPETYLSGYGASSFSFRQLSAISLHHLFMSPGPHHHHSQPPLPQHLAWDVLNIFLWWPFLREAEEYTHKRMPELWVLFSHGHILYSKYNGNIIYYVLISEEEKGCIPSSWGKKEQKRKRFTQNMAIKLGVYSK